MNRLDKELVKRGLMASRSQALNYIKMGKIKVGGRVCQKPAYLVGETDQITIFSDHQYVSRAGFKLESVAQVLQLDFKNKVVLDVGSSTGGFTDFALQNGARKVYAVDVGTNQLHPKLRSDRRVEVHEKTDIRDFKLANNQRPDLIVIDVSFISVRQILPHLSQHLVKPDTQVVVMLKPQFEAGRGQTNRGVIKNNTLRRQIIKDFELWLRSHWQIVAKQDSSLKGEKGNVERFYLLKKMNN